MLRISFFNVALSIGRHDKLIDPFINSTKPSTPIVSSAPVLGQDEIVSESGIGSPYRCREDTLKKATLATVYLAARVATRAHGICSADSTFRLAF